MPIEDNYSRVRSLYPWARTYAPGGPMIDWEYFKKAYDADDNKREVNWDNLKYADAYLNALGYSLPQRQAIIYNMYQESGGNPDATSKGNQFRGLLQWDANSGGRYNKIIDTSLPGQLWYLHNTLYGKHALDGQNWMGKDRAAARANQARFTNAQTAAQAMPIFTHGYVRPNPEVSTNRLLNFQKYFPTTYERHGSLVTNYNTQLTPEEEVKFQKWRKSLPSNLQSDYDYDLRGAYINGYRPDENGHLPDLFKKPNHPTFSYESYYSNQNQTGGYWKDDDTFVPSPFNKQVEASQLPDFLRTSTMQDVMKSYEKFARGGNVGFGNLF